VVWILIIIGYIITIYSTQYWVYGEPYNRWISAVLFPSTRIIWALNTAAIIWMCITGNGGLVNKFLSWEVFIPLSRLTYSVYLTHAWIVWYYWGSRRDLVDLSNFTILTLFSANILICYVLGALFSLLFESPTLLLQNYLKKCLTRHKRRQNNNYITPPENNDTKDSQI
jgi:peptidoglycan/LPS O-acetylase OafA/YrhL